MDARDRALFLASGVLLSVTFITGGSSQETGWGVMAAELLALVVLLFTLSQARFRDRIAAAPWGVAVAVLIVAIPLLQLLPLPAWLWQWSAPRLALQHDLAAAGITHIDQRWSLAPAATERDLYLLLPGLALFLAALALRRRAWYGLLWWLIGLAVFSAVLAFVQMGVPQDSFLNPFPQFAPALTGVFANRNHEASALATALVMALALLLDARTRADRNPNTTGLVFLCAIIVAMAAMVLPLVGSRAGVIVAIVGAALTLLAFGAWLPRDRDHRTPTLVVFIATLLVLAVGLYGAFAWMQHNTLIDTLRPQMTRMTARLAAASMPFGGGAGSFVRMFEQFTHGSLMDHFYINAAHDDYVQWWYAGGVLALVAMLAALAVLLRATWCLLQLPRESRLRGTGMAATLAIVVPLLHSTVDYPLRTPALMTAFAMLCGIAVASGVRARRRLNEPATRSPSSRTRPTTGPIVADATTPASPPRQIRSSP